MCVCVCVYRVYTSYRLSRGLHGPGSPHGQVHRTTTSQTSARAIPTGPSLGGSQTLRRGPGSPRLANHPLTPTADFPLRSSVNASTRAGADMPAAATAINVQICGGNHPLVSCPNNPKRPTWWLPMSLRQTPQLQLLPLARETHPPLDQGTCCQTL